MAQVADLCVDIEEIPVQGLVGAELLDFPLGLVDGGGIGQ